MILSTQGLKVSIISFSHRILIGIRANRILSNDENEFFHPLLYQNIAVLRYSEMKKICHFIRWQYVLTDSRMWIILGVANIPCYSEWRDLACLDYKSRIKIEQKLYWLKKLILS